MSLTNSVHKLLRTLSIDDLPSVILDSSCAYDVNERFTCPLEGRTRPTFADIEASAKSGCPVCIVHFDAISQCCATLPKGDDMLYPSHHSVFSEVVLDVGTVGDWAYRSIEFFPTDEVYSEPHLQKLGV